MRVVAENYEQRHTRTHALGVASGCGEQEAGVASGSGWNLWVWLLGVVVRRYNYRCGCKEV